jgi:hypothetical protein
MMDPAHNGTYALPVLSGRTAHIAGYGRGLVIAIAIRVEVKRVP